jgi:hypothetical protein
MRMTNMIGKFIGVLATMIVMSAFSTLPADAAKKSKSKPRSPTATTGQSLDGRVLGYPRTCGYDYYIYGSEGPVGPYCH